MLFFVLIGAVLLAGLAGARPGRTAYGIIAVAAVVASAWEYTHP
ncbi:MAG: hypothetical protein ACREPA_01715 [Candidatus Dormibacteraceae bacterium]